MREREEPKSISRFTNGASEQEEVVQRREQRGRIGVKCKNRMDINISGMGMFKIRVVRRTRINGRILE